MVHADVPRRLFSAATLRERESVCVCDKCETCEGEGESESESEKGREECMSAFVGGCGEFVGE